MIEYFWQNFDSFPLQEEAVHIWFFAGVSKSNKKDPSTS